MAHCHVGRFKTENPHGQPVCPDFHAESLHIQPGGGSCCSCAGSCCLELLRAASCCFVLRHAASSCFVLLRAASCWCEARMKMYRWAEAHIKIARMTLTIKLDGNWSSFQLANSAPPLSVTDSAIAPSARTLGCRALLETGATLEG